MVTNLTQLSNPQEKPTDKFFGVDFQAVITTTDTWANGSVMYRATLTEQIDGLGRFGQPAGLGDNREQAWSWILIALSKLFYTFRLTLVEDGRITREVTYCEEHDNGVRKPGPKWTSSAPAGAAAPDAVAAAS
jgi:hypothetical protein